jgi:hypothetical protein
MTRSVTAGFETEILADELRPALFVKGEFDSGDLRLWTGRGDMTFASEVYTGAANVLNIDAVKETQKLQANGITFGLNGVSTSINSIALTEEYQWRPISMWIGVLDSNYALIADPYKIFSGKMDIMEIADNGETSSIAVNAESNLIDLRDPKERRYTHEDQQNAFAGDLGLEFMPTNADIEITWGAGVK